MAFHSPDQSAIAAAAECLRSGQLVAFPTETVYGLGADATNADAVAGIFAVKNRPRFNPLIIHVPNLETALRYGVFTPNAKTLAGHYWPGALTLIVNSKPGSGIADLVTAGLDTIAIRVPDHPIAQQLMRATDRPLAAPSANRSGALSPTRADHVALDLGDRVAMILDGGATAFGIESTVIDVRGTEFSLLRPGAIARNDIELLLGQPVQNLPASTPEVRSPGQLRSHYAPAAKVRLNAETAHPGEALLAFGRHAPSHDGPTLNLSPTGDVMEAATGLFAALRKLDASGVDTIVVMPIPEHGLGEAINDRLRRAAAPRP